MDVVSLYSTWPDQKSAAAAGEALVAERLAACVNILPGAVSIYRWEGRVQREAEVVMLIKTSAAKAAAARDAVLRRHPYGTPCLLHLHIMPENSAPAFLDWVAAETTDATTL